jgi:hypothetical protein
MSMTSYRDRRRSGWRPFAASPTRTRTVLNVLALMLSFFVGVLSGSHPGWAIAVLAVLCALGLAESAWVRSRR